MSNALMRGVKADEDEEERCAEPDVCCEVWGRCEFPD